MDINELSKRYFYLTDEATFYDRNRHEPLTETALSTRLLKIGLPLAKVTSFLEGLKLAGTTRTSLDRRKGTSAAIDAIYESIKDRLPFRTCASGNSTLMYVLKPTGEVQLTGVAEPAHFATHITAQPEAYEAIHGAYISNDLKTDRMGLYDALFKRLITDPEMALDREPALVSWSASEPAYRVLDASILRSGPHPNWDSFLGRLDHAEVFKAFVWSIFEPANKGRQALWLRGEGMDGKSSVINSLVSFIGPQHVLSMSLHSLKNEFFTGMAYGKRLAVYMDCETLGLLRSARIKSLVAGDTVDINVKNEKQFSSRIYSKLIVASNFAPQINYNDFSERSRLLYLSIRSFGDRRGDPHFETNLGQEMGHFLWSCRNSYADLCPTNAEINVPPSMDRSIAINCSSMDTDLIEEFIGERLEFGDEFEVRKTALASALKAHMSHYNLVGQSSFAFETLIRMLQQAGVRESFIQIGELKMRAYKGVRLNGTGLQKVLDLQSKRK